MGDTGINMVTIMAGKTRVTQTPNPSQNMKNFFECSNTGFVTMKNTPRPTIRGRKEPSPSGKKKSTLFYGKWRVKLGGTMKNSRNFSINQENEAFSLH